MVALSALAAAVSGVAAMRWLRVAQREHYLPGVTRFGVLWWRIHQLNLGSLAVALIGAAVSALEPWVGIVPISVALVGPVGLSVRGRTSPLAWTSRLRRLAAMVAVLTAGVIGVGYGFRFAPLVVVAPLAMPALVDVALWILAPYERRQGDRWVRQAADTLAAVGPTIVAITGSYGKTSTKNLVAHLLAGTRAVVASPASFNNRMGLARAVNEHLAAGTEVFVAEMGTYGPGEIRELCTWVPPDVAVITALGPVHLERMGTIEAIATAKREILESARVGVVNVDHPLLAAVAEQESTMRRIVTVATADRSADVTAGPDGVVVVGGVAVGTFDPATAHPGNVAAAVGVLVALDVDLDRVIGRLGSLPDVPHRRTLAKGSGGFDIVDDTFNSNPAGAAAAIELLASLGTGRRVLVTPGMVELGSAQAEENRRMAVTAGRHGVTHLLVVNRTNREALAAGAEEAGIGTVILCDTREDAVSWVRANLVAGDAVLYENDLPDHYP